MKALAPVKRAPAHSQYWYESALRRRIRIVVMAGPVGSFTKLVAGLSIEAGQIKPLSSFYSIRAFHISVKRGKHLFKSIFFITEIGLKLTLHS